MNEKRKTEDETGVGSRRKYFIQGAIAIVVAAILLVVGSPLLLRDRPADLANLSFRSGGGKSSWGAVAASAGKLKTGFTDFLRKLTGSGPTFVEVDGHVVRPGPVSHVHGMTTRDALLAAGGADRFGQVRRVDLYRKGKKFARLDLKKSPDLLVRMEPGDRLEVAAKIAWEN